MLMRRQTVRIFYEVKGGVVKVLRTDPVLVPRVTKHKRSLKPGR